MKKRKPPAYLEGPNVLLRGLRLSDVNDLYTTIRGKDVVRWTVTIPWPYKKKHAVSFVRKSRRKIQRKTDYHLGIVLRKTNRAIGVIALQEVNGHSKSAEMGYWLGKKYWNKGYMTEAAKLMLAFGFEELKLHRISLKLFEKNIGSKRVAEKAGFKKEGVLRDARYRHGAWHNELRFGMLAREWALKH